VAPVAKVVPAVRVAPVARVAIRGTLCSGMEGARLGQGCREAGTRSVQGAAVQAHCALLHLLSPWCGAGVPVNRLKIG
jgi:hypothetical protein